MWKKLTHWSVFSLGILLFFSVLFNFQLSDYLNSLKKLHYIEYFLVALLYPFLWKTVHAYCISLLTPKHVSFAHLWIVQVSSAAVGDLLPMGGVGSEGYRAFKLASLYPKDAMEISFSLVLYNILYGMVGMLLYFFVSLSMWVFLPSFPKGMLIFVIGFSFLVFCFLGVLFALQKKGALLSSFLRGLRFIPFLKQYESRFALFIERSSLAMRKVSSISKMVLVQFFLLILLTKLLSFVEMYLIADSLEIHLSPYAFVVFALGEQILLVMFVFIPGQFGVSEKVSIEIQKAFGGDPFVGLMFSLLRRGRTLLWTLIGLIFLFPFFTLKPKVEEHVIQ